MQTTSQVFSGAATWALQTEGDYFRLLSCPTAVNLTFYRNNAVVATITSVDTGFYIKPIGGFDRVDVYSSVAQTVKVMILDGDGGYDHFNVDITSSLANLAIAQGNTIAESTVSVGVTATSLVSASASRKGLRFYNSGTVDVYIGSSGVTTSNGAIKIAAGSLWIESEAAPAAWYGISGSAAQTVRIQAIS